MEHAISNIFGNVWDTECKHERHVITILEAIREGKWKDTIESYRLEEDKEKAKLIKHSLPCVTFCGTFDKRRGASNMKEYSGVIILDIDGIPEKSLKRLKRKICADVHTAACFISPTFGLKVLFVTDQKEEYHKLVFNHILRYFKGNYNIEIDKSGKDVSRLCFVSYDPELYFNNNYDTYSFDAEGLEREIKERESKVYHNMEPTTDLDFIMNLCCQWVKNGPVGSYSKGNRNNYIYALSCNLNRAGVSEDSALMLIATRYQSLEHEELKTTVSSSYRNKRNEFGSYPINRKKSKQGSLI